MKQALLLTLLRALSRLPLRFNRGLGFMLGDLYWRLSPRVRQICRVNLEICFPQESAEWREKTARASVRHMAMTFLEAPVLWRLSADALRALVENIEPMQAMAEAHDEGRGLVAATLHLGNWELAGIVYASFRPITYLYRPPKLAAIDKFVRRGRMCTGASLATTDANGIRTMTRALRNREGVGMLPDQEADKGNGVLTDYFGTEAYTMTLLAKMAQRRRSPTFALFLERLSGQRKYRLHAIRLGEQIYDSDLKKACGYMNEVIETLIRIAPEQYNWAYKRFVEDWDTNQRYKDY